MLFITTSDRVHCLSNSIQKLTRTLFIVQMTSFGRVCGKQKKSFAFRVCGCEGGGGEEQGDYLDTSLYVSEI